MEDPVEVELSRMVLHAKADQQCVYLRVVGEQKSFRIVIGVYEAAEIHRKVLGEQLRRPMTQASQTSPATMQVAPKPISEYMIWWKVVSTLK